MSDILSDSETASSDRDRVLSELGPVEKVMFAMDGVVAERHPAGAKFNVRGGAFIVTNERLILAERGGIFGGGRLSFDSVPWGNVEKVVQAADGPVTIYKTNMLTSRWPIWSISKNQADNVHVSDKKRLDLLALSIEEARTTFVASQKSDSESAYEELKRRRES